MMQVGDLVVQARLGIQSDGKPLLCLNKRSLTQPICGLWHRWASFVRLSTQRFGGWSMQVGDLVKVRCKEL